jgi:hypothetical protein
MLARIICLDGIAANASQSRVTEPNSNQFGTNQFNKKSSASPAKAYNLGKSFKHSISNLIVNGMFTAQYIKINIGVSKDS